MVCFLLLAVGFSVLVSSEEPINNHKHSVEKRGTTVFFDDFSSGRIDPDKWSYTIYSASHHNNEFQIYSPDPVNSYIKNGVLYIRPTLTVDKFGENFLTNGHLNLAEHYGYCNGSHVTCDLHGYGQIPPTMSAKMSTKDHIRYGKVEVVAMLPKGDWLWPAIWAMPTESHYGGWPQSGEIDIMESRGNLNYHDGAGHSKGADVESVNVHYGVREGGQHRHNPKPYHLSSGPFGDAFHTYWMDWTADYIKLGVDEHLIHNYKTPADGYWRADGRHFHGDNIWADGGHDAPFDRPFLVHLNVAVGGNYFNKHYHNAGYTQPWTDHQANASMQFWEGRHLWEPTWRHEDVAMKVKSVKMIQY